MTTPPSTLNEWEAAVQPGHVKLRRKDIEKAAAACGFKVDPAAPVRYHPHFKVLRVRSKRGFADLMGVDIRLHYRVARREADGLVWKARLECTLFKSARDNGKVVRSLEKALELLAPEVKTLFPERIVTLPIPEWVAWKPNGCFEARPMFESGAKKAVGECMAAISGSDGEVCVSPN